LFFPAFRRGDFLGVPRLAQRNVDRVGAVEERDVGLGADAELFAHGQQVVVLGHELQALRGGLDGLFSIATPGVDER